MSETGALGVFGGSFDPPHAGHVLFVAYALAVAPITRILIVPTFRHPFGKDMAPFADRVAMCERAFAAFRHIEISRIEEELGGDSFTIRTVEALRTRLPETPLRLLVGADVMPETPRWRAFDRVAAIAPPFVVGRGPDEIEGLALPAVSSTDVRARYRAGDSIGRAVPCEVDAYVRAHGLYGATSS